MTFQQCNMLHIALGNNIATGYKLTMFDYKLCLIINTLAGFLFKYKYINNMHALQEHTCTCSVYSESIISESI